MTTSKRTAARFVVNNYTRHSHVFNMLEKLEWASLENHKLLSQVTILYKINQGLAGVTFPDEVAKITS